MQPTKIIEVRQIYVGSAARFGLLCGFLYGIIAGFVFLVLVSVLGTDFFLTTGQTWLDFITVIGSTVIALFVMSVLGAALYNLVYILGGHLQVGLADYEPPRKVEKKEPEKEVRKEKHMTSKSFRDQNDASSKTRLLSVRAQEEDVNEEKMPFSFRAEKLPPSRPKHEHKKKSSISFTTLTTKPVKVTQEQIGENIALATIEPSKSKAMKMPQESKSLSAMTDQRKIAKDSNKKSSANKLSPKATSPDETAKTISSTAMTIAKRFKNQE